MDKTRPKMDRTKLLGARGVCGQAVIPEIAVCLHFVYHIRPLPPDDRNNRNVIHAQIHSGDDGLAEPP